jgi:hypothetical protein
LRRSDLISGSLLVVAGLVMIFIIVPQQINSSSDYGLDPAFFPLALLWLIAVMAVLLVATRLRQPADPSDQEPVFDRRNWGFIIGASLFLVLAFVAIKTLGFVIAGTVLVAMLMFALELRKLNWVEMIGIAAIAPFTIHWLLYNIFNVQLPSGPLFP